MKKIIGIILLSAAPLLSFAQDWHVGLFGGISNYSGDLNQKAVDFGYTRPSLGLLVRKDINRFVTLRAQFTWGMVAAADSTNSDRSLLQRNLSFKSNIWEGAVMGELNFMDIDETGFTPYIFGGVGLFSFYPKAKNANGEWTPLRPLRTEGQGLPQYPERPMYSLYQVSLPFGFGAKYILTDNLTLGVEIGWRKTFTDYLDDVSNTYIDENTLLAYAGQQAVDLAFRGDETGHFLPPTTYPPDGTIRGNPKKKDWYVFSGLTLTYRIAGSGTGRGRLTNFSKCFRM